MRKHSIRWYTLFAVAITYCASFAFASEELQGELLYNGIQLPSEWPPRADAYPVDPQTPPYLKAPPVVIPIDVGRQLFVDDFLIDETTLKRTFHRPEYYKGNPILRPDQPWELTAFNYRSGLGFPGPVAGMRGPAPLVFPFSDGVWFDPQKGLFRMWYYGGEGPAPSGSLGVTCYATSKDGINWVKPKLKAVPWLDIPETNIVHLGKRDSSMIWLDHNTTKPDERFKMWMSRALWRSPDGIAWTQVKSFGHCGDRTTFFYNPFRQRWVFSIKSPPDWSLKRGRTRLYYESEDFFSPPKWGSKPGDEKGDVVIWAASDSADPKREGMDDAPQIYNLDAVAYESLILGFFSIWRGDTPELRQSGRPKLNEVFFGFSRDGFHWDRPDRQAALPISENKGDWNWGNVQSAGGGCLVVGNRLYFYVSGRAGSSMPGCTSHSHGGSTGLAFLRRDGFASMDANGQSGTLTTRPLRFVGKHLFVNAVTKKGSLTVEILDGENRVIEPFNGANCIPIKDDGTILPVSWNGAGDLATLRGKPVRFRFHLDKGSLYSFWVSPDKNGASHGYVAGGGPGFTGSTDTVGKKGYEENKEREAINE